MTAPPTYTHLDGEFPLVLFFSFSGSMPKKGFKKKRLRLAQQPADSQAADPQAEMASGSASSEQKEVSLCQEESSSQEVGDLSASIKKSVFSFALGDHKLTSA